MTIRTALLRAVNLGPTTKIPMAELREVAVELGLRDVRTLIASGNLVFDAGSKKDAALETALENAVERRFGLKTDIFVRTAPEWAELVAQNPFPAEAEKEPALVVAMVLRAPPAKTAETTLNEAIVGRERARIIGRCAYIHYPDGQGRSRLTGALIERRIGTRGTMRNWNTVRKLDAMLREAAAGSTR